MTCCNVLYVPRIQKWVKKRGNQSEFHSEKISTYRIGTLIRRTLLPRNLNLPNNPFKERFHFSPNPNQGWQIGQHQGINSARGPGQKFDHLNFTKYLPRAFRANKMSTVGGKFKLT